MSRNSLVLEDSPTIQRIAIHQISKTHLHVEVHVAADGSEALLLVQQHHYSLILMDLHLPGMDGWEVARKMRATRNGQGMPILAVSADGRRSESLAAGMNDHLVKPVHYGRLVTRWLSPPEMIA
jgi:CheY-like chemotaxis protein